MRKTESAEVASIMFALANVISKLLGFVRDLFLSNYFGVSKSADALSLTLPINSIFQNIMTSAIVVSFIPIFLEELNKDRENALKTLSTVFNMIILVFLVLAILIVLFSNNLVSILAPGFKEVSLKSLTSKLIDFVSLSAFLWAVVSFLFGVAQSRKHFFITAITPLFANIFTIIGLVLFHRSLGIFSYVVGLNVGLIVQFLIMIYYSTKYLSLKFNLSFDFRNNLIKKLLLLSIPLILLQLINYLVTIIANRIASALAPGSIASIQYANKLRQLWISLLTIPIATAYYPFITEAVLENDKIKLSSIFKKATEFALLLGIPITTVSFVFAHPIVSIVFGRGAFNEEAVKLTTYAFRYFSIGIFALMVTTISMRVLYAMKEMYLVLAVSVVVAAINILLFYPFVKFFGHGGIPLSISIGLIVETIAFLIALEIKTRIKLKEFFLSILKIGISSVAGTFVMYVLFTLVKAKLQPTKVHLLLNFVLSSIAFLVVYIPTLKLLKVEEVQTLNRITNKIFKR